MLAGPADSNNSSPRFSRRLFIFTSFVTTSGMLLIRTTRAFAVPVLLPAAALQAILGKQLGFRPSVSAAPIASRPIGG